MGPGGFNLGGTGLPGQSYVLLSASNLLAPEWIPLATNTADTNGAFSFSDASATNYPQKYYRVLGQ
jgi:hypothetical protein